MQDWPNEAIEAVHVLSRILWDIQKAANMTDDRGAYNLMCEAEVEMHARNGDPRQTDFRDRLPLTDGHAKRLAERV